MKIKHARVSIGRTVNLGNFESLRIDIDLSADLEDNENPHACAEQLRHTVKLELEKAIREETRKHKEKELW